MNLSAAGVLVKVDKAEQAEKARFKVEVDEMSKASLVLVGIVLAETALGSRVGSVLLSKHVTDSKVGFSQECFVSADGVTVRTVAGGTFDPNKLIVNKQYPGGPTKFFGFGTLERQIAIFNTEKVTTSKKKLVGFETRYEARTFDADDNPMTHILYEHRSDGTVQERSGVLAMQYRVFLDSVCN